MVDINLLPWRDLVRREHKKNIMVFYVLILGVVFMMLMSIQLYLSHKLSMKQHRYDLTISQLSAQTEKNDSVDEETLMSEKYKHQRILFDVFNQLGHMKNAVSLSGISRQDKKIMIKGSAESLYQVKHFMSEMLSIKNIDCVTLTSLKNQSQYVQFELLVMEQ